MPTTAQQILTSAYGKSKLNVPGTIATESAELLGVVNRSLRGLFAFAARINPIYFAAEASVAAASAAWTRPAEAESIFRIEEVVGGNPEVALVPFDDRTAEPGMPAVYELGQVFRIAIAGGVGPAPTSALRFFYAKRSTELTALTGAPGTIEALWPESYNELLILEVAIYLAMKDKRIDEVEALKAERNSWATLFQAHLEHASVNLRRRFGHIRRFNTSNGLPLSALLAGGSGA